ncbi:uncharacterized protein LOC123865159 isoform X2 [Maniola jurtina]|nr:uncharacterized protein LOC123865159 isoform X2 [Maniola jurtina]
MNTQSTGIYHWKWGDIALARVCKKVCAKVQVVKNEDGLFYDEKVLGITVEENGLAVTTELCYYVETVRTKQQLWLPYTCMHLAERSRPFYGYDDKNPVTKPGEQTTPKKRKIIEDHVLPPNKKPIQNKEPDSNQSLEKIQTPCLLRYGSTFREFVRIGKEKVFDDFCKAFCFEKENNTNISGYIENKNVTTEAKFEIDIKNIVTGQEVDNHLHRCWKYDYEQKEFDYNSDYESEKMLFEFRNSSIPLTVHAPWCLVCGDADKLWECINCPSSYHIACRREWLVNIIHRRSPPRNGQTQVTLVEKILSGTRTITSVLKEERAKNIALCPSCIWGPRVGYGDVIWHKLDTCSWWPAKVLTPGAIPTCLLARNHSSHEVALKYYGTLNYSWGDWSKICLFLPKHTGSLEANEKILRQAVLDASDDYIAVYLT